MLSSPPKLLDSQDWQFLADKRVIIACSGGPDSMVLLDLFRTGVLPSEEVIIAHVNHHLRPTADRDEAIVRAYCAKYGLRLEVLQVDVKKEAKKTKTTLEECARNIRRAFFEKLRVQAFQNDDEGLSKNAQKRSIFCEKRAPKRGVGSNTPSEEQSFEQKRRAFQCFCFIATAHHADDQAETLLYRIIKGTSITGLVGIQAIDGPYIRPLLNCTKSDLLTYAKKHKIPYGLDETNDDISIPRNLLRKEIIPKLETINCGAKEALIRLGNSAKELHEGFDEYFENALVSCPPVKGGGANAPGGCDGNVKGGGANAPGGCDGNVKGGGGNAPGGCDGNGKEMIGNRCFSFNWYHSLPLGFQHEFLRFIYEKANGSTHGLSLALINELDRFLSSRNGGIKEIKKLKMLKKNGVVYLDTPNINFGITKSQKPKTKKTNKKTKNSKPFS